MTEEGGGTDISLQVTADEAIFEIIEGIPGVEKAEDGALQVPIAGARTENGGKGYLSVEKEASE